MLLKGRYGIDGLDIIRFKEPILEENGKLCLYPFLLPVNNYMKSRYIKEKILKLEKPKFFSQ